MELAALLTAGRLFIALATTRDGDGQLAAPHRHLELAPRSEYGPSLLYEADADLHRAALRRGRRSSGKANHQLDPQFIRAHPPCWRVLRCAPAGLWRHERWIARLRHALGPIEEDPSGLRAFRVNRSREAKTGRGKRVVLDEETWRALDLLMREQMKSFEEISAEAFRDLLRKYANRRI